MGAYSALAVTRDVSAELLLPAEAAFDAVSELVEDAVMGSSQGLRRDDRDGTHGFDDGVGVIATLGHHDFGRAASQQWQRFGELQRLSAGKAEGDRFPAAVGQQVILVLSPFRQRPRALSSPLFWGPWPLADGLV